MALLSRRGGPRASGASSADRSGGGFEDVLREFGTLLRSLLRRSRPERYGIDLDDLEQEARIRLWKALSGESDVERPASYIYRVAASVTIDAVRRMRARREDVVDPSASGTVFDRPGPLPTPENALRRRELATTIADAVASLDTNRRLAVRLHLQGFTTTEIGRLLEWTEPKARNLVSRGMADLRTRLANEGIDVDASD
jgi:RNA polymerase sigma-70 factor (ECF subfamily)